MPARITEDDTAMSIPGWSRKGVKQYYVYMLASRKNGTLYVGVTSDLPRRIYEHKNDLVGGFTKAHQVHRLVYYEATEDVASAIKKGKAAQEMEKGLEIGDDREGKPRMERPLS